jgi:hypothetical protein
MSGSARRAEKSVIVLPEPGGPHKTATKDMHSVARKECDQTLTKIMHRGIHLLIISLKTVCKEPNTLTAVVTETLKTP